MNMIHYVGGENRLMNEAELAEVAVIDAQISAGLSADQAKVSRNMRDKLLADCDWTQAADSPLTTSKKSAWATYRAALRNLPTADAKWPNHEEITWPTEPS
jgi:hypothetical protein